MKKKGIEKLIKAIKHCDSELCRLEKEDDESYGNIVEYHATSSFKDGILFAAKVILGKQAEIKILKESTKKKRKK